MSASSEFSALFTKKHLKHIYNNHTRHRPTIGLDGISLKIFQPHIDREVDIIYRKSKKREYSFTTYKGKILSKGPNKYPRVISIPTLRDKITLKSLSELLAKVYNQNDYKKSLHSIIKGILDVIATKQFNSFIRLDIKEFYPSIPHDQLEQIVRKKIKKPEVQKLIFSAIATPTRVGAKDYPAKPGVGVPQGLSISNMLADIYLWEIDQNYASRTNIAYFRYVDDILIFFNNLDSVKEEIKEKLGNKGLNVHVKSDEYSKCQEGTVDSGFSYLGYVFKSNKISVRKQSVVKIRESLTGILVQYKYAQEKKVKFVEWAINIRITGCLFGKKRYGWLQYYSQLNDKGLLFSLDSFVNKQLDRFGLDANSVRIKRFVRAWNETNKNISNTNYIPNYDHYSREKKKAFLSDTIEMKNVCNFTEDQVEYEFRKRIYSTVAMLEKDIGFNS